MSHRTESREGMRLSTRLIIALTVIVLVVLLIGIYATYPTFVAIFTRLESWGELAVRIGICVAGFLLCVGILLLLWFVITEIQIRRQRLVRYAPTPEGYYEALLTRDGFMKPMDNIPLQCPDTYSPHIAIAQTKGSSEPLPADDATVMELFDKGISLKNIADATGRSYYQVQKITRNAKKRNA